MITKAKHDLLRVSALGLLLCAGAPASAKGVSFWKGRTQAAVSLTARAYSVPKAGEEAAKNQDAHAADPITGRFAVADGVSRSVHPREWAEALTEGFVKAGPGADELSAWLAPLRVLWQKRVDEKLGARAQAAAPNPAPKPASNPAPATHARVSIFEDFAGDSTTAAAAPAPEAAQERSAGEELMAELALNPGRKKKPAPTATTTVQADTNAGAELLAYIGKSKTEEKGASATLLGLEVKPGAGGTASWRSTALRDSSGHYSDSVVFQVRERKGLLGWIAARILRRGKIKSVDQWPPLASGDFDTRPAQLRTKADADGQTTVVTKDGDARRGDRFMLTTDALGKWVLDAKGRERSKRLERLLGTKDQAAFSRLVAEERERGLGNDDSTVMVVDVK